MRKKKKGRTSRWGASGVGLKSEWGPLTESMTKIPTTSGDVKHDGKSNQGGCPRVSGGCCSGADETEKGPSPLPCLYSNNSTENKTPSDENATDCLLALGSLLTAHHKRQAQTLFLNTARIIENAASIGHIGFLTLTFPDNVTDHREAYKRFRSFNTHFLAPHYDFVDWLCVKERQKRGSWHYHLVVSLSDDIREGVDFDQLEKGDYSSAGPKLRDLWQQLREALPKYGFGRSELLPIRSNAQAMGRYIGKYISKHIGGREDRDKGVRLVNYSRGWVKNSVRFSWHTKNAAEWRRKLSLFAQYMGCSELYQLSELLGSGWAYRYVQDIMDIDFTLLEGGGVLQPEYRSIILARADQGRKAREVLEKESPNLIRRKSKARKSREDARNRVGRILTEPVFLPDLPEKQDDLNGDLKREWLAILDSTPVPGLTRIPKHQPEGVPF